MIIIWSCPTTSAIYLRCKIVDGVFARGCMTDQFWLQWTAPLTPMFSTLVTHFSKWVASHTFFTNLPSSVNPEIYLVPSNLMVRNQILCIFRQYSVTYLIKVKLSMCLTKSYAMTKYPHLIKHDAMKMYG